MNKSFYLILFVLALTVTYAASQAPARSQGTQAAIQASPAEQPGQSGVTSGQSGSPSSAQTASSPGLPGAGPAAVNTGKIPVTENPQASAANTSDRELQSRIQQALDKEPTLAGDAVSVIVSARSIDLSGRVANPRQKLAATRIVESYAQNRKVVNHLTIGNTSGNTTPTGETGNEAHPPGRPDLSSHPEPEKGSPPGTSTRPPQ